MGEILKAKCKCGYETTELKFGAGMTDFEQSCYVPAIDNQTNRIIAIDIKKEIQDKTFLPYSQPSLHAENCKCNKIEFFDISINKEKNYCPQCQEYNLCFMEIGFYD